jgi:hypothetical protein
MPGPDPDIAVEPASSLVPNADDPRLAALAADPDLPLPQVKVAPAGSSGSYRIPVSSDTRMPVARNTEMIA